MALRDLFTTARLVTLLVMSSVATGLVQKQVLNFPNAHDLSSTILRHVLMKLERLDAKMESLENGFAGLRKDFTGSKRSAIDSNAIQENVLKKKDLEEILTRILMLTDSIEEGFSFLKDDVKNSWQQLQLNTEESASKILNAFQNVANKLNYTLSKKMQSALKHFFVPQSCKKNAIIFHPFSTPYPVIYNNEFPGVDTPLLCDTVTDGGGWIVIQRRSTGDVDFYRNWKSYKVGFGTLDNDFWLGNDNIHTITSTGKYELRVDLKYNGTSKFALYDKFVIDSEDDKYKLHVGTYSGTAGDSLKYHNGYSFSTFDKDNDKSSGNCAVENTGAWWYNVCHYSNLNGKWGAADDRGLAWWQFTEYDSATFSEMKLRRLNE
ncbi:hypothetical protein EGW08_018315 [Elysia chlorotica]|uniref:Fibrinogen C-terminal domain-containing protein n=1 Tax=Elysia chlorotica TaxID=188477 RepID=A0A3S0ZS30_ELYCH|nr:hypothetical protein EGW08_018315 [Elysia chlorotica]